MGFTILTGLLFHFGETEKTTDTRNLLQTHKVIHSANQLFGTLRDAETGQRGYLITANDDYLTPYYKAIKNIDKQLARLKQITDQKPEQQEIIENKLQPAIDEKIAELKKSLQLFEQQGGKAAVSLTNTDTGHKQMDIIRSALDEIINNEEQLLQQREEELDQSYFLFNFISYGGLFFIGVTIITALVTIYRQNKENRNLIKQLENRNKSLADLHNREVKLSNEKSKFMSIAAHDLRSPLNAIISITELIQEDKDQLTKDQQEYLEYIATAADQMSELTSNFLDVQKIEEERNNSIQAEDVNVHNLLKAIIMGFQAKANPKDISLNFESKCRSHSFCTDKAMFSQVAENLISNAIKFSPPNTTVSVALHEVEEGFQLIVKDEGPGLTEEDLEQLYTPYADLSTEPTGGETSTGLGLPIIKNRIETLGGTIDCKSEVGKGTVFTAHFPELDRDKTSA